MLVEDVESVTDADAVVLVAVVVMVPDVPLVEVVTVLVDVTVSLVTVLLELGLPEFAASSELHAEAAPTIAAAINGRVGEKLR